MNAFPRNAVGDDFRVNRSVKNCAGVFHLLAQFHSVDQISVVCQRHFSLDVIDHDRLGIVAVVGSGGAVADVPYGDPAVAETLQNIGREHVVHKPGVLIGRENPVVVHHDPAGFLSPVLQGKQSVIGSAGNIGGFEGIDAEHAAFFSQVAHAPSVYQPRIRFIISL